MRSIFNLYNRNYTSMENDNKVWSYEYERNKQLGAGQLLLSEPFMLDENFKRTVVLICEHDDENGTVGLILNKSVNLRLGDIVEGFTSFKGKVYLGGPVGTDTIQFLHTLGNEIDGAVKIADRLYWGGNFDQLRELAGSGTITPHDVRFYLGYSGWSPNQLLEEMKENSWIVSRASYHHVFETDPNSLWKNVMNDMGGVYSVMAGYPENPILN